ncbi:MFS transporter [Streptomyces sp. SDT5-1]|uniref:MFS transporter n=1 Tax=Streptomyces sp. SDT5-1 TaxID=3406418 RepID=UPI003FD5741E
MNATTSAAERPRSSLKRVVAAGVAGHVAEWYDYLLYGYVATTIAAQFFPSGNSSAGLLATFATFALSFVARPVGAIIFGHFGDRIGRTKTLSATVTLITVSTVGIGLIPSHETIGFWAPALLVVARILQGISAGGELTGGTSLIVEYAPVNRRGFLLGFLSVGLAIAAVLASGFIALMSTLLSPEAFNSWGWRVPFWAAAPIGLVGLYIRLRIEDTPAFNAAKAANRTVRVPIVNALRSQGRRIAVLIPFFGANAVANYYLSAFYPTFMVTNGALKTEQSLLANLFAFALMGAVAPAFGYLADRAGRKTLRATACLLLGVFAFPTIMLAASGVFSLAIGGLLLLGLANAAFNVAAYLTLTELFHVETRYTSGGVAYNLGYAIFGGTAPLVGTTLVSAVGSMAPAGYAVAFGALGLLVALSLPETRQRHDSPTPTATKEPEPS